MKATSYLQAGNQAFAKGDYSEALAYYRKALEAVRGDPNQLADLYGNIGNVYGITGQLDQAVVFYQKAIEILRREEDYGRLGTTYVNIGNLYTDRQDPLKAIHFYKQAALLLENEENWEGLAILYGNLSLASFQASDWKGALDYAEKAMALAKRLKRPGLLADASHRLAKAKGAIGQIEEAQLLSEQAYDLYTQLKDEMGCAAARYHQVFLCEKKGDLQGAIQRLTQVVAFDEKYNLPKLAENRARLTALQDRIKPL
jgi:tetratricopeptide (TPR) repeat protein